jgi:hypothetical protein
VGCICKVACVGDGFTVGREAHRARKREGDRQLEFLVTRLGRDESRRLQRPEFCSLLKGIPRTAFDAAEKNLFLYPSPTQVLTGEKILNSPLHFASEWLSSILAKRARARDPTSQRNSKSIHTLVFRPSLHFLRTI